MIVLEHNKNLQNLIGLGGYDDPNTPMATRQLFAMTILMSSSLITCSINLYNYKSQVKIATELMFCAALYVIVLSSFFTFIKERDTVRGLFHEIQRFVDSSEYFDGFDHILCQKLDFFFQKKKGNAHRNDDFYPKTEKMIQTLTKYYFIFTLAGSVIYGFVPFMVVGFCMARDTYTLNKWTLHYNNVWWVSI